jgi:hypothetical protein
MIPHVRSFPQPIHVWLILDQHRRPIRMHLLPELHIDALDLGWYARKVTLNEAIDAIAKAPKRNVRSRRIRRALSAIVGRAERWINSVWLCEIFHHRFGATYAIGDTGEYDADCVRCHESADGSEMESRLSIIGRYEREAMHRWLCRFGSHVDHDYGDGCVVCVWCWDEIRPGRIRRAISWMFRRAVARHRGWLQT